MNRCPVNHTILDPVSTKSFTPVFNSTGTVRFDVNTNTRGEDTFHLASGMNYKSIELFTFKNTGFVLLFSNDSVMCQLYFADCANKKVVGRATVFKLPKEFTTSKAVYGWIVGRLLTDSSQQLWYFDLGSNTRNKYGTILNHMMLKGDPVEFSAPLGNNKRLSFKDKFVQVTNKDGETIYQSRVSQMQKTLLKD